MDSSNGKFDYVRKPVVLLAIGLIIGLIFCITGIILLSTSTETKGYEVTNDYTDCKYFDNPNERCKDVIARQPCACYIALNISEQMEAPVTAFYELESYELITGPYSKSRDDQQLSGHLSPTPAASCGNYSYVQTPDGQKKPIAPCGALADFMFNDTFSLQVNSEYVPTINTGLISDDEKEPFHNPEGNLEEAFKQFSKPINWPRNVTQLDRVHPENNGFQNEHFIIWMKTDLKRKPTWRVNVADDNFANGLAPGSYNLRVEYAYPASRYDGKRLFVLSSRQEVVNKSRRDAGIALLSIGVIILVIAISLLVLRKWERCRNCLRSAYKGPIPAQDN
uniref:Cell cycle control protein 50A n=1 Tax=Heliothis virescens TaxID=7102 RepID=A0A2A4JXV9_HELVI